MTRLRIGLLVAAGIFAFLLANAHLLYVAFSSQPDCVAHVADGEGQDGAHRAASSSC